MTPFDEIPKAALYKALKRIHSKMGITCGACQVCTGEPRKGLNRVCNCSFDSWIVADMVLHYDENKRYPFDEEEIKHNG